MTHHITVSKDSIRCPLTKEYRWTAKDNTGKFVSSGSSAFDAVKRVAKRIVMESDPFAIVNWSRL